MHSIKEKVSQIIAESNHFGHFYGANKVSVHCETRTELLGTEHFQKMKNTSRYEKQLYQNLSKSNNISAL